MPKHTWLSHSFPVHDGGKWIADLDILGALSKGSSQPDHKYFYRSGCSHSADRELDLASIMPSVVTINSWDEFLEHPKSPAVCMAHGNWGVKLALVVLGVRRGDRVFVNERICAECFKEGDGIAGVEFTSKVLYVV